MRSLASLAVIKQPPKSLHLVDIALFLSILPHLDRLKFPMLVYLFVVFAALAIKKSLSKPWQYGLMLFGLLSVVSSFYADFNFSSFSKFALYLSFLNALLIYAVTLQRMKGEVNFYLAFSPGMLLMLSFFLHNSVGMLFYMVFTLFVFLLLFVWQRMNSSLAEVLKMSLGIFAYALPVVALLFLVFPRISFEKANYGFQDELIKRSGHNGKMSLGSDALMVPSPQVIMELYFDKPLPKGRELYFRGTTLYVDRNDSFQPLDDALKAPLEKNNRAVVRGEGIGYKVTLYPHGEKWLYGMDLPDRAPDKSTLFDDYTMVSSEKIDRVYRYALRSHPDYTMNAPLSAEIREAALQVDESRDKISAAAAKRLSAATDGQTLGNLVNYFRTLDLTYTLKPDPFDTARPVDSFLQESKRGYCVHFAAAFTYMARAAGLPARVVTGFLVSSDEALENYLVVREYAAHAWVEVYLEATGWTRVETTALAQRVDSDSLQSFDGSRLSTMERLLHYTNLRFMYAKYLIETWILEYSRIKQMEVLHNLLNNTIYLVKFIVFGVLFVVFSVALALFANAQRCRGRLLCLMAPFLKRAERAGYTKSAQESMHDFLMRLKTVYDNDSLDEIDRLYHRIRYAQYQEDGDLKRIKVLLKSAGRREKEH